MGRGKPTGDKQVVVVVGHRDAPISRLTQRCGRCWDPDAVGSGRAVEMEEPIAIGT
jgi:hypothetical protein